jgi:hypothetical protein
MKKTWHVNSCGAANGRIIAEPPPPPPYCLKRLLTLQKNNNHYITTPAGAAVGAIFLSVSVAFAFSSDAVFARRSVKPSWTRRKISTAKETFSFFHIFLATMFPFGFIRPHGGRFSGMARPYLYTFKVFGASIQRVEEVL